MVCLMAAVSAVFLSPFVIMLIANQIQIQRLKKAEEILDEMEAEEYSNDTLTER